jgi:hypothetical protein
VRDRLGIWVIESGLAPRCSTALPRANSPSDEHLHRASSSAHSDLYAAHHTPSPGPFYGELETAAGGHESWITALARRQWLQARTEIEITVTQIKNEVTAVDVSLTLDM